MECTRDDLLMHSPEGNSLIRALEKFTVGKSLASPIQNTDGWLETFAQYQSLKNKSKYCKS